MTSPSFVPETTGSSARVREGMSLLQTGGQRFKRSAGACFGRLGKPLGVLKLWREKGGTILRGLHIEVRQGGMAE